MMRRHRTADPATPSPATRRRHGSLRPIAQPARAFGCRGRRPVHLRRCAAVRAEGCVQRCCLHPARRLGQLCRSHRTPLPCREIDSIGFGRRPMETSLLQQTLRKARCESADFRKWPQVEIGHRLFPRSANGRLWEWMNGLHRATDAQSIGGQPVTKSAVIRRAMPS